MSGELDIATARILADVLRTVVDCEHAVIDCSGLTFFGTTGLNLIVAAANRLKASGGAITIRHAAPAVRWLFTFTAADTIIHFIDI